MDILDFLDDEEAVRIEAMSRDELVEQVKLQICYGRETLFETWQERKELRNENKRLSSLLEMEKDQLKQDNKHTKMVKLWRRTSYLLAILAIVLCFIISEYSHATF